MIKIKYYIKLSVMNLIKDRKSSIKNILIMTCSFMLFILTFSISGSLNKFINNYILNTIDHSTIMIDYNENNFDEIIRKLESNNKILEFYKYQTPIGGNIKNYNKLKLNSSDMLLVKSGFTSRSPQILSGRMFNETEENVGIIPKKFDPSGDIGVNFEKESKEYLDGEEFLGKIITLDFENAEGETFQYTFKVVGIYNSISNMDYPSDVYIPYKDIEYIHKQIKLISQENTYVDTSANTIIALVDDQENVEIVLSELNYNNIYAYKKAEVGLLETLSNTIAKIGLFISIIVFIVSIINVSLNNLNNIRKRQHEIGMLKVFGYKNIYINRIIFSEVLIVGIVSILISTIFCKVIFIFVDIILKNKFSLYMSSFNIDINLNSIIVSIALTIISVLVLNLRNIRYITSINTIDAIKNKR